MIIERKRCKHCNSIYEYYKSGSNCFSELNNENYCPECMKAIKSALKEIPIKYIASFKEIHNDSLLKELTDYKDENINTALGVATSSMYTNNLNHDNIELYNYDDKQYAICYNEESDKHLFILQEYDIINKKFTDNYWSTKYSKGFRSFKFGINMNKFMEESFKAHMFNNRIFTKLDYNDYTLELL